MIQVRASSHAARRGRVEIGPLRLPCALGRSGLRARKREGDGTTPLGSWRLDRVLYRSDRGLRPRTGLAVQAVRRDDGWCDAPGDRNYNRAVRHPYPASAEQLWRADELYDIVVVLGHNRCPRVRGHGSAIFMHVARPGFQPTEGCVALRAGDLRRVLARVGTRGARLIVS
ncbi:MAG: L,D-transpeptidase family protein [Hyphomicrobiaceae bacterium]|nr:L,D-transpeptidase family protein [Hyphomicrobiaceae bacterium]